MTVVAKFRLTGITTYEQQKYYSSAEEANKHKGEKHKVADLEFNVVQANANDPNDENSKFFFSTPNGQIKLSTVNQNAIDEIVNGLGKEFYVKFELAPNQKPSRYLIDEKVVRTSWG